MQKSNWCVGCNSRNTCTADSAKCRAGELDNRHYKKSLPDMNLREYQDTLVQFIHGKTIGKVEVSNDKHGVPKSYIIHFTDGTYAHIMGEGEMRAYCGFSNLITSLTERNKGNICPIIVYTGVGSIAHEKEFGLGFREIKKDAES